MSGARSRRALAPLEVHYRPAPELAPDEARRRVRLAYALVLGLARRWLYWECCVRLGGHGEHPDLNGVAVMMPAGLRVSELTKLRTSDVALRGHAHVLVRQAKDDRDRRVPLSEDAHAAIAAWLAKRPVSADDHVFLGQRGGALSSGAVQLVLRKLGRQAKIEKLSPHRLRHEFVRSLLRNGVDLVTVRDLVGHANVGTTALYAQPSEEELRAAVQRLARRSE